MINSFFALGVYTLSGVDFVNTNLIILMLSV